MIDTEEADLVRHIAHLCLYENLAVKAIAKHLTSLRIPTHRDRRKQGPARKLQSGAWHPGAVHKILTNEAYIGTLYWDKNERLPGKKNPDKKTRWRQKPKEQWIAIPVPAILDEATFHAIQRKLENNARKSPRNRKHDYLLTNGRLRCGHCGCAMHGQCDQRNGRLSYRCTRPKYQLEIPCRGSVTTTILDTRIWDEVVKVLRHPEIIAAEIYRRQADLQSEQDVLDREYRILAGKVEQ